MIPEKKGYKTYPFFPGIDCPVNWIYKFPSTPQRRAPVRNNSPQNPTHFSFPFSIHHGSFI